jgi:hypothetical protein
MVSVPSLLKRGEYYLGMGHSVFNIMRLVLRRRLIDHILQKNSSKRTSQPIPLIRSNTQTMATSRRQTRRLTELG